MISFILGVSAALFWGTQNIFLASESRKGDPRGASFRFFAYMVPMTIPVVALTWDSGIELGTLGWIALGGVLQGVGVMMFTHALSIGPVGLLSGLLSLEGAWVAVLSVVTGESVGIPVGIGLLMATAGGATLVVGRAADVPLRSIALVIATVSFTATGLFILSYFETNVALTMLVYNSTSALAVAAFVRLRGGSVFDGQPSLREERVMLAASALGLLGLTAYTIGSQAESAAVTAVLAAQFGAISAVAGYFLFRERLRRVQIVGFVILALGVGVIAGFT